MRLMGGIPAILSRYGVRPREASLLPECGLYALGEVKQARDNQEGRLLNPEAYDTYVEA